MYGLPHTFDASFLKGKEITSICFAAYQVNLYLEADVRIQIEGRYQLLCGDELVEAVSTFPVARSSLPQMIGRQIVDVSFSSTTGDIEMLMESGLRLRIDGDHGPYESYRLFDGIKETIV